MRNTDNKIDPDKYQNRSSRTKGSKEPDIQPKKTRPPKD